MALRKTVRVFDPSSYTPPNCPTELDLLLLDGDAE
jgi:hypothetical protein